MDAAASVKGSVTRDPFANPVASEPVATTSSKEAAMARIVISTNMTLDGVVQDPDG